MATHNVTFKRDKETNKKIRFTSPQGENVPISGSLYVDKALAGDIQEFTLPIDLPVAPAAAAPAAEAAPAEAAAE